MPKQAHCVHCGSLRSMRGRGLCSRCHGDPEIRDRYTPIRPGRIGPVVGDSMTVEELDAVIAEQLANLPKWWELEAKREAKGGACHATLGKPIRVLNRRAQRFEFR